jgi:hypothetical protein
MNELSDLERNFTMEEIDTDFSVGLIFEAAEELADPRMHSLLSDLMDRLNAHGIEDSVLEAAVIITAMMGEEISPPVQHRVEAWIIYDPPASDETAFLPLGYRGQLRPEGMEAAVDFRIFWGKLENKPGEFEEVKIEIRYQPGPEYEGLAQAIEEDVRFSILRGQETIGKGGFSHFLKRKHWFGVS